MVKKKAFIFSLCFAKKKKTKIFLRDLQQREREKKKIFFSPSLENLETKICFSLS